MTGSDCPFCPPAPERVIHEGNAVAALWDGFPVSPGHALVVPRRHVASWFDTTPTERDEILKAIDRAREAIFASHTPDGFNIGLNDGASAGQTVFHLHVHIIPRYAGDANDPRGGVRQVVPHKAKYWATQPAVAESLPAWPPAASQALVHGGADPFLPHLAARLQEAASADIVVAFTMPSGVGMFEPYLREFIMRGGVARFLTGDYLDCTDPRALTILLDISEQVPAGSLELRIFETRKSGSFHPKAYLFHDQHGPATAYVGSSNLTGTALKGGLEWNYRVLSRNDRPGLQEIQRQFNALWDHSSTRVLDHEWVNDYRRRRKPRPEPVRIEAPPPPVQPHSIQEAALKALDATRLAGNSAGLVILATGLGKTWLSAFDSKQPEYRRVLFVAHRDEILSQAMNTYRRIRPEAHLGKFSGTEKTPDADVMFASIQTLHKTRHLMQFSRDAFDYLVIDEFHHAAARTYRRLIDYFQPKFLLGLTATPERTDGGDLLGLCQENLVYRCDLANGIRAGLLSPFKYFGVPDDVDYSNIPWRSSRFDEEALTTAVATQRRAQNALEQWRQRGGIRTLAFCCSTRHADFMADFFRSHGLRVAAVHSGASSDPRSASLEALAEGSLQIVFSVDMLNEGIDLPDVDTVMMLRPTESRILWLQQFGRGLRVAKGKKHLRVIDYIGNHRIFLIKPQTLLGLGSGDHEVAHALEEVQAGSWGLPPGCEVVYELEAVNILRGLLRTRSADDPLLIFYGNFTERRGERPTALECFHEGYLPGTARKSHGSWLGFVQSRGDLSRFHEAAFLATREFLETLETTPMTRSYKMVLLLALLNLDALPGEAGIEELTKEFGHLCRRSEHLQIDVSANLNHEGQVRALLEQNPIKALTGSKGARDRAFFTFKGGKLKSKLTVAGAQREALQELIREIVDWRLAAYLGRATTGPAASFTAKVSHANGRPILFLPDRATTPDIPSGWTRIIANDAEYEANFVKVAINVLRQIGAEENLLPQTLTGWFGPDAGRPGTNFQVRFDKTENGYELCPLGVQGGRYALHAGFSYTRDQVAATLGLSGAGRAWQTGCVIQDNKILLFVTLNKAAAETKYAYSDRFLSPDLFEWKSQNRTPQNGSTGEKLRHHASQGLEIHLFVRKDGKVDGRTQPFFYCGELEFKEWEGEKPITVRWHLKTPLSDALTAAFLPPA